MSSGMKERLCRSLEKVLHAETRELPAVAGGILLFFLLFLAYSMLRPVRETMGIAGGVQNLQWLFTATFAASIGGQFLFGWVSSKVRRKAILPWTYGFFILNLAVFAALVLACPGNVWTARSFYVWLSVFNLLTVSVAWSVLSDVMKPGQMKRLFALVASGSSLGAMAGLFLWWVSHLYAFSAYPFRTRLPGDAAGATTGAPEVRPTRSSRTRVRSTQISNAHCR